MKCRDTERVLKVNTSTNFLKVLQKPGHGSGKLFYTVPILKKIKNLSVGGDGISNGIWLLRGGIDGGIGLLDGKKVAR